MFRPSRLRSRRASALASACLGVVAAGGFLAAPLPAAAANQSVRVVDNAYDPGSIEVRVGETVTWTWAGENPHSVTSPGSFDSHPECTSLTPGSCGTAGETFAYSPASPGTIDYRCRIHADMSGTIVVAAAPAPEPTPSPSATPSPTASPAPPPSPTSSPRPTVAPSPAPTTPRPSPSASPTPTPTPRPGPPSSPPPQAVPTITPTASPTATARPTPSRSFTPFPSAPSTPTDTEDPLEDDVVAVAVPGGDGPRRTPVRILGATVFGLTAAVFGRYVLFAPPWDT